MPPGTDDPQALGRAAVTSALRDVFAGVNLEITDERPPPAVEYTMIVVGGRPQDVGLPPQVAGFAPLDCGDTEHRDVVFVFSGVMRSLAGVARVSAQEAGHAFGLEHVREPEFVMYPLPDGQFAHFSRSCVQIDPELHVGNPDGIQCLHTCASPQQQNAYEELLSIFGPDPDNPPEDRAAPTVGFIQPAEGAHIPPTPGSLRVFLGADDDIGVAGATLSLNGGTPVEDPTYPFAFDLSGLPEGAYRLEAEVWDRADRRASAQRVIYVGNPDELVWPEAPPGSVVPNKEAPAGDVVRCAEVERCPAGTRCIDGICLRPQPTCAVETGTRSSMGMLLLVTLGGLRVVGRRRRRPTIPE